MQKYKRCECGYKKTGSEVTSRFFQILRHGFVHDVFQGHSLFNGEKPHAGVNALVDDEIAMYRRFFPRFDRHRLFFRGNSLVDDSRPSNPLFMPSFNESLLLILSYFNFNTSCANAI